MASKMDRMAAIVVLEDRAYEFFEAAREARDDHYCAKFTRAAKSLTVIAEELRVGLEDQDWSAYDAQAGQE